MPPIAPPTGYTAVAMVWSVVAAVVGIPFEEPTGWQATRMERQSRMRM
jgi:hypothetical protein